MKHTHHEQSIFGKNLLPAAIMSALAIAGCTGKVNPEINYCIGYSVESPEYAGSPDAKGLAVTVPSLGKSALGLVIGFRAPNRRAWADSYLIQPDDTQQPTTIVLKVGDGDVQFRAGIAYDRQTGPTDSSPPGQITFSANTTGELPEWEDVRGTGVEPGWDTKWYGAPPC